nr:PadR family transcriptional regulator [Patulibacter sp. SYSU D01012]
MLPVVTRTTFFVLASLADGRRHGYGIVQRAAELSGGDVRLATGTLYGALDRLAGAGLVVADGDEVVDGRLRRYYRLTDAGAAAVRDEAARLRRAADVVATRLGPAGGAA